MSGIDVTSVNEKDQMECNADSDGVSVKTFVIFDTETTGLPSPGNKPHITELCFVALTREELHTEQRECRVLNKLIICFNPCKNIPRGASEITGLYNDSLEDLSPFSKQAPLISMFLRNLPQPVCLIAHNGNGFDFPLLVSHLKDANEAVPKGILCADSIEAFRVIDGLPPVSDFVLQKRKANKASLNTCTQNVKPLKIVNGVTENVCDVHRASEGVDSNYKNVVEQLHEKNHEDCLICHKRTPDLDDCDENHKQAKISSCQTEIWDKSICTPHQPIVGSSKSVLPHSSVELNTTRPQVKRRLFEGDECNQNYVPYFDPTTGVKEGAVYDQKACKNMAVSSFSGVSIKHSESFDKDMTEANTDTEICDVFPIESAVPSNVDVRDSSKFPSVVKTHKVSYSLECVYKRVFHQAPEAAHRAEADCLTLLKIIRFKFKIFSSFCDKHAVPLDSIDPMY